MEQHHSEPVRDGIFSHYHNPARDQPGQPTTEDHSLLDTHDYRILDPVTYDGVRGEVEVLRASTLGPRRFAIPNELPKGAKWAVEDRHEHLIVWGDEWKRVWENRGKELVKRGDLIQVPVWWQRAGRYTDAWINERARFVIYHKTDGSLRIFQPLREGISASSHIFFGYTPRRCHVALWFLLKTPSNLRRLPRIVRESGTPESSHHTGHAEAGCDARRDIVRHAVYGRLMTGWSFDRETCSQRRNSNPVRPLAEEMEALLHPVDNTRFAMFPSLEKDSQKPNVCKGDARDEMFVTAARHPGESRKAGHPSPPDRDDLFSRSRTNRTPGTLNPRSCSTITTRNGLSSSRNGEKGLTVPLLVQRHRRPEVSVVVGPHPGARGKIPRVFCDPGASDLQGAGPPFAREEMNQHWVAHNDHEAYGRAHRRLRISDKKRTHVRQQHEEFREKHSKLGQRRTMEIGEEDKEEEERLGYAGRGQDWRDQEQRRHEEGGMARTRRRIPGDGSWTKLVSAAVSARNRFPTNPVKGSPGQVGGMSLGPSSPDAGNEDRRSERRPSPQLHEQEIITVWEARQETLAILEGRS
ncbi:hypothetical protein BDP55DRAFT_627528 [Colletotrichum godetiae]|uniref:Uncharacterized protein n=1 Tax=Colletotrichum godetiae TaxID=1209918 RepID=A0AAJ0EYB3_9PEZI|nr:uncharacterized protein BDP55DRAFT_627528 [Colletotrichum godetiae]KAK1690835.1 hypothetical protein BDP55DRAFT_627528 [Colletotrichum godetiae]